MEMTMKPFSALLPRPRNEGEEQSFITLKGSKNEAKDTIIFDNLRPENLPLTSIHDFVPLRQRNISLEIPLPTQAQIEASSRRTKRFINSLIAKKSALVSSEGSSTKNSSGRRTVTIEGSSNFRAVKVKDFKQDPLQPNTIRKRKVVAPSEEMQAPILHKSDEGQNKPSKAELDKWKIPSAVSNWKNPKGFAIALEKRVAIESHAGMKTNKVDKFLQLTQALDEADAEAREKIRIKQESRLQEEQEESQRKAEKLRALAEKSQRDRLRKRQYEDEDHHRRQMARNERIRIEQQQELTNKMSTAEKLRRLAYQQGRDVSEKVMLNAAKATETPDLQYDSRLFAKGASKATLDSSHVYDRPLFDSNQASNIYRPPGTSENDEIIDRLNGRPGRTGPVEFTSAEDIRPTKHDDREVEDDEYGLQTRKPPDQNN